MDDIWWEVQGRGPGIVFTHGAGDDARHWDGVVPLLVPDHTVVRWDLPGHGRSARPDGTAGYARDRCLRVLDHLVERAGAPAVLVGHSYGGYLSLAAAILHPERVRALVLIATGPGFRSAASRARWNEGVDAYAQRLGNPAAAVAAQHDSLVLERLGEIRCPVQQICGERDRRFHDALQVIEATVPDVSTTIVDDAGHAIAVTHTARVAETMRAFLARIAGSSRDGPAG